MKGRLVLLILSGALMASAPALPAQPSQSRFDVVESRTPFEISWATPVAYERVTLVVVDEQGEVARRVFRPAEPLAYDLLDEAGQVLPDGTYSYQVRVRRLLDAADRGALDAAQVAGGTEAPDVARRKIERVRSQIEATSGPFVIRRSGRFQVQGGTLVAEQQAPPLSGEDTRPASISPKAAQHVSTNETIAGNLCVGSAECDSAYEPTEDLEVVDATPTIDLATCAPPSGSCLDWWRIQAGGDFSVRDQANATTPLVIEQGAPTDALHVGPGAKIGIGTVPSDEIHVASDHPTVLFEDLDDASTASLSVDNHAAKLLADAVEIRGGDPVTGSLVQVDANGVGIGAAPNAEAELLVYGDNPDGTSLRLFNGGDLTEHIADLKVSWPDLTIGYDPNQTGAHLLRLNLQAPDSSLVVDGLGRVGLGVADPSAGLHLRRDDGSAQILVQEQSSTTAGRTMLKLDNNGYPRLVLSDSSTGAQWVVASGGGGALSLNRVGSGVVEMQLFPGGNMTIHGSLTEGSSRKIKQDFEPVDVEDVLDKVLQLPLLRWTYKASARGERHLGPMAEDFHGAFGLGESTGITALDGSGVALAAVRGLDLTLDRRLAESNQEIEDLRARNAELERRLEALEKLAMDRLAACTAGAEDLPGGSSDGDRVGTEGGR